MIFLMKDNGIHIYSLETIKLIRKSRFAEIVLNYNFIALQSSFYNDDILIVVDLFFKFYSYNLISNSVKYQYYGLAVFPQSMEIIKEKKLLMEIVLEISDFMVST